MHFLKIYQTISHVSYFQHRKSKINFSSSVLSQCPVTNDKSLGQKPKEVYYQVYLIKDSKRNE